HEADMAVAPGVSGSAAGVCGPASRTIVWFPLVAGRALSTRTLADVGSERAHRCDLPGSLRQAASEETGARSAGGSPVFDGGDQRRRRRCNQAGRSRRGRSRAHEQDADAHAAARATGIDARPANEAQQTLRTVAEGSRAAAWARQVLGEGRNDTER